MFHALISIGAAPGGGGEVGIGLREYYGYRSNRDGIECD